MKQMNLNRKKILMLALAILLIAGAVVAAVLIPGSGSEEKSGTIEGSPWSCTWEKQGRKTVLITVCGQLPENAEWTATAGNSMIEVEQQEDPRQFMVKALAEGYVNLEIRLRQGDMPAEIGADLRFSFSVDEKGRISFSAGEILNREAEAIEVAGTTLCHRQSKAGSMFVYIKGASWRVDSYTGLSFAGPTVDGDSVRLEVMAEGTGSERSLVLKDEGSGAGIKLVFTETEGALALSECSEVDS